MPKSLNVAENRIGFVKTARKEMGITQAALARALGTTVTTVARWECGSVPISNMHFNHVMLLFSYEKLRKKFRVA